LVIKIIQEIVLFINLEMPTLESDNVNHSKCCQDEIKLFVDVFIKSDIISACLIYEYISVVVCVDQFPVLNQQHN